jgi:hypothetical protein
MVLRDGDEDNIVTMLPIKIIGNETHVFSRQNSAKELEKYYGFD